jgi:hypothetical protein
MEQKDLTGVLFRNDRKELPNHPDRKGSALIGGVEYWVAGWLKDPKGGGGQFLSLAFTPKEAKGEQPKQAKPGRIEDMESDIPF